MQIMSVLSTIATATKESLEEMTVKDLRILSKGRVKGYGTLKKEDLITALLLEGVELRQITENVNSKEAAESVGLISIDTGEYSLKFFSRFKKIVESNINPRTGEIGREVYSDLAGLAIGLISHLDNIHGKQKGGGIADTTKLRYKSEVMTSLKKAIKTEKGSVNYKALESSFDLLNRTLNQSLADKTKAKKENYKQSIGNRFEEKSEIDSAKLDKLFSLAEWFLSNVETMEAKQWKQVSISLAIATGRRQSEVHNTNTIFTVDGEDLQFTGQLKARGLAAEYYEENPTYKIPCLVAPELVVNAHQWLKDEGKTETDAKKAHNRFSRYLSEAVKGLANELDIDIKKLTYKSLRGIYSQIAVNLAKPGDENIYIAEILGHSRTDWQLGKKYLTDSVTPRSYSADWKIK